jgi:hypothetical protein
MTLHHLFKKSTSKCRNWQEVIADPLPKSQQHQYGPYNSSYPRGQLRSEIFKENSSFTPNESIVLLAFMEIQGKDGQLNISNERLSARTRVPVRTLKRVLSSLEQKQIIEHKHYIVDTKKVTAYRRQINVRWNSLMISDRATVAHNSSLSSVSCISSLGTTSCLSYEVQSEALASQAAAPQQPNSFQKRINDSLVSSSGDENTEGKVIDMSARPPSSVDELFNKVMSKGTKKKEVPLVETVATCEKYGELLEALKRRVAEDTAKRRKLNSERSAAKVALHVVREEERPLTKAQARLNRLTNIPTIYPDYQKILDREQVTLNELRYRMWDNWEYEPFTKDQWWNDQCHSDYALMTPEERDTEFRMMFEIWMWPKPYRYASRQIKMFHNARMRADTVKAKYYDYIAAQYEYFGCYEINYERVCCKAGAEIYERWAREEREYPKNEGFMQRQNKRIRAWSEGGGQRGKMPDVAQQVEQQRLELAEKIAVGYKL